MTERKLIRIEARNAETPIEKKPEWIKTRVRTGPEFLKIQDRVKSEGLHTVCQEAGCPNIYECWEDREATFLIGGDQCTRRCDFCQIDTGKPQPLDRDEPRRVAESVKSMGLKYATVTGVARDDLEDEGAWLYAETVRMIHETVPGCGVEVLIPDFSGNPDLLGQVFTAAPEVLAHNLETVPSNYLTVRPGARYFHSIRLLQRVKELDPTIFTKSGIMVGLGETKAEVGQVMDDMRSAGVDFIGSAPMARMRSTESASLRPRVTS